MQSTLVAIIAVLVIIAIAAYYMYVEKKGRKGSMTAVYGKSFMNLPHGPLEPTALQRPLVGTPQFEFHPSQVAGTSFSRM